MNDPMSQIVTRKKAGAGVSPGVLWHSPTIGIVLIFCFFNDLEKQIIIAPQCNELILPVSLILLSICDKNNQFHGFHIRKPIIWIFLN